MISTNICNKMMPRDSMKIGIMLPIDWDSKLSQTSWSMAMNPIKTEIKIMVIQTKEDLDKTIELKLEDLDLLINQIEDISFQLIQEVKISQLGSIEILDQLNLQELDLK